MFGGMWRESAKLVTLIALTAIALLGAVATAEPAGKGSPLPIKVGHLPTATGSAIVIVEKGDHLWSISARHLTESRPGPASNADISPYWRLVVEVNTAQLKSQNPDLIYPGEEIKLPAIPSNG